VVPFFRCAVGDCRAFPEAPTSTVEWRGRPRYSRGFLRPAYPLLVEAIGEGKLPAALAPEVSPFRVPHRKGPAEHYALPTLFTQEDDPLRRTVHLTTPRFFCGGRQTTWHTLEATTTSTSFELTQALVNLRSMKRKFRVSLPRYST